MSHMLVIIFSTRCWMGLSFITFLPLTQAGARAWCASMEAKGGRTGRAADMKRCLSAWQGFPWSRWLMVGLSVSNSPKAVTAVNKGPHPSASGHCLARVTNGPHQGCPAFSRMGSLQCNSHQPSESMEAGVTPLATGDIPWNGSDRK